MSLFRAEYQCTYSAEDKLLDDLAAEYHQRTEAFDRIFCTGPIGPRGRILPADSREHATIDENARKVRDDIFNRSRAAGIPDAKMKSAISHYRPIHPNPRN